MRKFKWFLDILCLIQLVYIVIEKLLIIFNNVWGYEMWLLSIRIYVRLGIRSVSLGNIISLLIYLWPILYLGIRVILKPKDGRDAYERSFGVMLFRAYIILVPLSLHITKMVAGAWFI